MKIVLSAHARERMRERGLKTKDIQLAILHPDRLEVDRTQRDRWMVKRVYRRNATGSRHLLMVIFELHEGVIEVITVISTSKIRKYL